MEISFFSHALCSCRSLRTITLPFKPDYLIRGQEKLPRVPIRFKPPVGQDIVQGSALKTGPGKRNVHGYRLLGDINQAQNHGVTAGRDSQKGKNTRIKLKHLLFPVGMKSGLAYPLQEQFPMLFHDARPN